MEPSERIDVAVIGGGIAGLACARELAGVGRKVAVFEMATGQGASWAAAGMLSPWAEGPGETILPDPIAMREESLALYPAWIEQIQSETGMPIDMSRCGAVVISLPGEPPAADRLGSILGRAPGARILGAEEARVEAPLLGSEIQDAVLLPEEGYVDPVEIMGALRHACGLRQVAIREEPVLRLIEEGGKVLGVRTPSGGVHAGKVLNAAGAWAGSFLHPEGESETRSESIRPIRGQILSLRPTAGALRPRRVIHSTGGYLVPRGDGTLVVGATGEDVGFERGVTVHAIRSLLERAERIAPSVGSWALDHAWSGFRPHRDGGPMIGPDGTREGLYHAVGLFRHGILLAPYVARKIREQIG